MNFNKFVHQIFLNSYFAAMYAVNITSPAQLPLASGCQNSGETLILSSSPYLISAKGRFPLRGNFKQKKQLSWGVETQSKK